jgi:hypothetical protein
MTEATIELPAGLASSLSAAASGTATSAAPSRLESTCTPFGPRPRLVDGDRPSPELRLIQLCRRTIGVFFRGHLYECESSSAAGSHVTHDLHRLDLTDSREQFL